MGERGASNLQTVKREVEALLQMVTSGPSDSASMNAGLEMVRSRQEACLGDALQVFNERAQEQFTALSETRDYIERLAGDLQESQARFEARLQVLDMAVSRSSQQLVDPGRSNHTLIGTGMEGHETGSALPSREGRSCQEA